MLTTALAVSGGAVLAVIALKYRRSMRYARCLIDASLKGKVALVTGATSGLGMEVAYELAKREATVIMAGRNKERLTTAINAVRARIDQPGLPENALIPITVEQESLDSVKEFSKVVHEQFTHIDFLINNAGVMAVPYGKTSDGFETHFGVNFVSHYLLTELLWDLLLRSEGPRVINVSSGYYRKGHTNWAVMNDDPSTYVPIRGYATSKLANILHAIYLTENKGKHDVIVCSLCPGFVRTNLGRHYPAVFRFLGAGLIWFFSKSPQQGVQTYLHCILASDIQGGKLYRNCAPEETSEELVVNPENVESLIQFTKSRLDEQ